MEKKLHKNSDILLCTCPFQPLVAPGCVCELCMGLIAEAELPILDLPYTDDRYDLAYFEALERLYEDVDFAA